MSVKETELLRKETWNKEDIKSWLELHPGEYLLKRVEIKTRDKEPEHSEFVKRTLEELHKATIKSDMLGPEGWGWGQERATALLETLPGNLKAISCGGEGLLDALIEFEPKAQKLISMIIELRW